MTRSIPSVALAVRLALWLGLTLGGDVVLAADGGGDAIVRENALPGSPRADWDVEGAGDPSIQGFSTDISVNRGETIHFKVRTDAARYRIEIYRVGYYGGAGARRVAAFTPGEDVSGRQPACLTDAETGLIDCGNWHVSASWAVPADSVSGVYFARLVRTDTSGSSHVMFIVRDDRGTSDLLVQTSDTTWQAYNDFGGNSLYVGQPPVGRAYKVSYNRPLIIRSGKYRRASFWANEYPMIRWLEGNGYDVSYTSGVDTARRGELLNRHKVFVSSGHDEYWSGKQRANVESARDAGMHLAFFSGNAIFWKTRWEPSIDGSAASYRTLVTYKETHAGRKIDPSPLATGTWRDPRFSLQYNEVQPENELKGSLFVANCCRFDAIVVSSEQGKHRFWRHTDAASLGRGRSLTLGRGTVGYEWDSDLDNGYRPAGLMRLSATSLRIDSVLLDFGSTYGKGDATHNVTLYRHPSGALVFATGTVLWSWALDSAHDDPDQQKVPTDMQLQQATANMFADMSVLPDSPRESLVISEITPDREPPVTTVTERASLIKVPPDQPVRIVGTASDKGGVPAGVEVSTDNGASWHPAIGINPWRYEFTPGAGEFSALLVRAVDDSGNLQPVPTSWTRKNDSLERPARAGVVISGILGVAMFLAGWRSHRRRTRQSAVAA